MREREYPVPYFNTLTKMDNEEQLLAAWDEAPIPMIAASVGDYGFYLSLLAGLVSRVRDGETLPKEFVGLVAKPDAESTQFAARLREKTSITVEQREFLEFVELTEKVRLILLARSSGQP